MSLDDDETRVQRARDPSALYDAYLALSSRDDGGLAEAFSETVARILVDDWDHVGALARYTDDDPRFESFVIRHFDITVSLYDARAIRRNAETRCPNSAQRLCHLLVEKAAAQPTPANGP